MTEYSLPWQGEEDGDHGPYDSADWRDAWKRLFGGGISDTAAIIPDSGPQAQVPLSVVPTSPASRSVAVEIGSALVRGVYYRNTSSREIELNQNNTSNPRIDLITLRINTTDQTVRLIKKQGSAASNPVAPSLTQSGSIYEIALAEVRCNASFTSITASNITPLGIYLPGGSVQMALFENNTGSDIEPGRLVQQDTGNDQSIELAELVDDAIGVSLGRIENGEYGVVATAGVVLVYFSGSVTRGNYITLSSTDGVANDTSSTNGTTWGSILESATGAGFRPVLIADIRRTPLPFIDYQELDADTANNRSTTYAEATEVTVNFTVSSGRVLIYVEGNFTGGIRVFLGTDELLSLSESISNDGSKLLADPQANKLLYRGGLSGPQTFTIETRRETRSGHSRNGSLDAGFQILIREV